MKYVRILITRDECPMACASTWEFGVYPEDKVAKALQAAKRVATELDKQVPGSCQHEVKEVEIE